MKRIQFILLLLFIVIDINICSARSLISSSNCIIGYKSVDSNLITVRPTSSGCYSKCNEYCLEKFKLYNGSNDNQGANQDKDLIIFRSGVTNVNKDRLESCLVSCYNGQRFDTTVRIPIRIDSNSGKSIDDTGELPYPWRCDIKSQAKDLNDLSCNYKAENFSTEVNGTCSRDELEGAFYGSELSFKAGDTLSVNVSNITDHNSSTDSFSEIITTEPNNIYLCGFKTVFFSPEYFIKDKSFKGDAPTNTLFSPRNNKRINTGIKVKKGDSIKIQYMGRYNSYCPGNHCTRKDDDYKIDIFIGSKKIDFHVSPYQLNDYDDEKKKSQSKKCQVCSNSSDPICSTVECGYYQDQISQSGLNVSTFWLGSPNIFKVQPTNYLFETYSQFRSTILSGKIQDGSSGDELIIQYPDIPSNNQQGGYFASIEWRGCNFKDGERIEYTIVNEVLINSFNFDSYMISPNGPQWRDLTMRRSQDGTSGTIKIESGSLNIPHEEQFGFNNDPSILSALPKEEKDYKGKIFFRIKLLNQGDVTYLDPSSISRANTVGSYNLKVVNLTSTQGFLSGLVNSFVEKLQNIPKKIFNGFKNNSHYLIIVRLVLIFYIAFTGFMFMSGMAQITQQEAVIRITKIAVVLMLLTENSFEFFNNYLFQGFGFDSINFLANTFTPRDIHMDMAPGLSSGTSDCFADGVPVKMLCVLEKDLILFFQWSFWNRILGLASSGFFIAAVGITIGIIMYATVIIKITALYCVSLLSMTITLSLAPIFLPLMLFKYTSSFFNSWIKQLISLLLQPVFIFVSISLFRALFIVLIQSLMGNGACKMCWLEFFNWCWFEVYIPLSLGSSPSFASMPMSNIGVLLALYFVGHGMYSFCDEVTKMGNRMISFSLFNISSAKVGVGDMYGDAKKFGSMTYNIATAPLDLMAIDDKSMDQRRQMRKVRRDKQNNDSN